MLQVDLEKMRVLRIQKGITQGQMAKALGYKTPLGYHYLESGRCQLKAQHLPIIADLLGIAEIEELFIHSNSAIARESA